MINSIFFLPRHSFNLIFPAISNLFLLLASRKDSNGLFFAFHARLLKTVPSFPDKTDLMWFSPIIFDEIIFKFSITNFGSLFPEPNGAREFIRS